MKFTLTTLFSLITIISFCQVSEIDSTILHVETEQINDMKYVALYNSNDTFIILDSLENEIFRSKEFCRFFEFIDFNQDGNKDIIFNYVGNNPTQDLLLFCPETENFIPVENFSSFPMSKRIAGAEYYYSYHRSGCADLNWDSDIFHIKDFKAVAIGNISGMGCENEENGIFIHRLFNNTKTIIDTFSIDTINSYSDYKWGFIDEYWRNNYKKFK